MSLHILGKLKNATQKQLEEINHKTLNMPECLIPSFKSKNTNQSSLNNDKEKVDVK